MKNTQLHPGTNQIPGNVLNDFHVTMTNLPIALRDKICEECNWSIPTYYRKYRAGLKGVKAFSKSEELTIMRVYIDTLKEAFDHIEQHKKIQPAV